LQHQQHLVEDLISFNSLQIAERFPPGLLKRWPGYALARALHDPKNLISILLAAKARSPRLFPRN
jgi:hypothetical protein